VTTAQTQRTEVESRTILMSQQRAPPAQINEVEERHEPSTPRRMHAEVQQRSPALGTSRSPSLTIRHRRSPSPNTAARIHQVDTSTLVLDRTCLGFVL
jgi:hypothetical protein